MLRRGDQEGAGFLSNPIRGGNNSIRAPTQVDTLRRDARAVVRRIEALVVVNQPTERPAWLPGFRERYDAFREDGEAKGINFSLSIAIELARRMIVTAHDSIERGTAENLLGIALSSLGERESGTARLEEAVMVFRAALEEWTRECVPLDWAKTQNNLGNALKRLGERESGTARLEEAVMVFRVALEERTRERVPLDWAITQNNLGIVLRNVGRRKAQPYLLREALEVITAAREVYRNAGMVQYEAYFADQIKALEAEISALKSADSIAGSSD